MELPLLINSFDAGSDQIQSSPRRRGCHQPSGVDQGVKILTIGQKSKQRILRSEKINPQIWHYSVFFLSECPICSLLQHFDKKINQKLICNNMPHRGKGTDEGKLEEKNSA